MLQGRKLRLESTCDRRLPMQWQARPPAWKRRTGTSSILGIGLLRNRSWLVDHYTIPWLLPHEKINRFRTQSAGPKFNHSVPFQSTKFHQSNRCRAWLTCMSWMLCESSHSLPELALALMWIWYRVGRTQQLCPRPNTVIAQSNRAECGRASARCVNLKPNWKAAPGSILWRNLAFILNQLINWSGLFLLPNE